MQLNIRQLREPDAALAALFTRWENDPLLVPLIRPSPTPADLAAHREVTVETLHERLQHATIYLIELDGQPIGEVNYQIDPAHLYRKVAGTAWIAIMIGEAHGRGKGVGQQALAYLERQIWARGLPRIELGVFAFNHAARKLYQKLGYREIGEIADFTYWQAQMWADIRMEKLADT